LRLPRKLKQSFLITSKRAVAAMEPSFLSTIDNTESLPILVFLNLSTGVPSGSVSLGFSIYKVGSVPSPLNSNTSFPVLLVGSPFSTIASNTPPYVIMFVGLNATVMYLCLCGSIVNTSGFMISNAKPSLLLYERGFT
jgi:hypothetical protein